MTTMLSKYFSLDELVATQHRAHIEANIVYARDRVINLRMLCTELLDPAREILGVPVLVNSGIRCPALNAAVGGSATSSHLDGLAADIIAPGAGSPHDVARRLFDAFVVRGISFDQIIYEHTWVHLGIGKLDHSVAPVHGALPLLARRQVLTLMPGGTYTPGIVLRATA